jgi:hypothetical protein
VLSADTRSVKVWDKRSGANFTTIEAPSDVKDFIVLKSRHNLTEPYECDDSGVVCICCDAPRVQVHFIPQLGVAPRWASFLDAMTEELEDRDDGHVVYDDYTFVGKEEMDTLGLTEESIAQGKVRPAMHGCYIENALYRELRAVVSPGEFARHLIQSRKKKIEQRWEERISRFKRVRSQGAEGAEGDALTDPRFASRVATNPAFKVDESNPEYSKLLTTLHERRAKAALRRQRYDDEQFTRVDEEQEGDADNSANAADGSEDEESKVLRDKRPLREKTAVGSRAKSVAMYEAKHGANFTATEVQTHYQRKQERRMTLTLQDQLNKVRKGRGNRR